MDNEGVLMEIFIRRSQFLRILLLIGSVAPVGLLSLTGSIPVQNFTTTVAGTTTVAFDGVCSFNGDYEFEAHTGRILEVRVGEGDPGGAVIFKPNISVLGASQHAHLIFKAEENSVISVKLFSDLDLTGSNLDESMLGDASPSTDPADYINTELTMSFRGSGTTVFEIANGKKLLVTSLIETAPGSYVETAAPALVTDRKPLGTSMFIAMDEDYSEVFGKGHNKVVFQRESVFAGADDGDIEVQIGLNSLLTFVSPNHSGLDDLTSVVVIPPVPTTLFSHVVSSVESYAAIAFDVSNFRKGKTFFVVKGDPATYNSFTDGSFMLSGQYLQDRADYVTALPGQITYGGVNTNNNIRQFVNFGQRAGSRAVMRVVDNAAYYYDESLTTPNGYKNSLVETEGSEVGVITIDGYNGNNPIYTRRGLYVVCSNSSHPQVASNPYGDSAWYSQEVWAAGRGNHPVQPGFSIGVNGQIEVNHNCFLNYEAAGSNLLYDPAAMDMAELDNVLTTAGIVDPGTIFKERNPSALLADGLGSVLVADVEQIKFLAHIEDTVFRRAEITLYGNASLNLQAPLLGSKGNYDGFRLPVAGETLGDGVYVLDVEGPFTIRSLSDEVIIAQDYTYGLHEGSDYPARGAMRISSLWRSYDDREIYDDLEDELTSYVKRPLAVTTDVGGVYTRYDRGSIMLNDSLDLLNLSYHHEDVSRNIVPSVVVSPPTFFGGERADFLNVVYGATVPDLPMLRFYNSTFHCHESVCMSGLRLVVREVPDSLSATAFVEANNSAIVMYNHGYELDTNLKGFARIFLLGSALNLTYAGNTSRFYESAYMSIFRDSGGTPGLGSNPPADPIFGLKANLSLQTAAEVPDGVSEKSRGIQMFYLGNDSNVELGWTSDVGLYRDDDDISVFPWDHRAESTVTSPSNKFNLDATEENPATLSFDGDFISLGGTGPNGEKSPKQITGFGLGRVIYVGHGGKMQITQDLSGNTPRPYIGFSDATIAILLWKASLPGLGAQLSLPYDQMVLKNPIRPYGINMSSLTDSGGGTNAHLRISAFTGSGLGTVASIDWNSIQKTPGVADTLGFYSSNGLRSKLFSKYFEDQWLLKSFESSVDRAVSRVTSPVPMPSYGLLSMSTGDYLDQLAVSGATLADPFLLYLTGDQDGISQVREMATEFLDIVPGEGGFARILMDNGARVGLGSRSYNDKSVNAWSIIGHNYATIIPNGDCQVDVNSDLIVGDAQPLIPTVNFGSKITTISGDYYPQHRVTFFSHDTKEVRVPSGYELDLSAFGQADTTIAGSQQIAFGGRVRLIFEPGSTLRFPSISAVDSIKQPVIYINENAEIIFEAIQDMENKLVGDPVNNTRWLEVGDTDRAKIRLLGVGSIWINKTSKMFIHDNALVAVESDETTPITDITFSLQREAQLMLGDPNTQGGSLQVGNPLFNVDSTPYIIPPASNPEINFTLRLDDENTLVLMGRTSFLGFGVGAVDRWESKMNNNWKLQQLQHVNNINLRLIKGTVSHNQIYDGSSSEASLMAVGPATNYKFEFLDSSSRLLGGGNLMFVADSAPASSTDLITVNVAATAANPGSTPASGIYSLLGSAPILRNLPSVENQDAGTTLQLVDTGSATGTEFSESGLNGGFGFSGNASDAFKYLSYRDFARQSPNKFVVLGRNKFEQRMGYVAQNVITRKTSLDLQKDVSDADVRGVKSGVLQTATITGFDLNELPSTNKLPPS